MKGFLKKSSSSKPQVRFEIISQKCSLCDPFQNLLTKFCSVHKHGSGEWVLLALYGHEEILKKSSSLKPLVSF